MRLTFRLGAAAAILGAVGGLMASGPAVAADKKPVTVALFVAI